MSRNQEKELQRLPGLNRAMFSAESKRFNYLWELKGKSDDIIRWGSK